MVYALYRVMKTVILSLLIIIVCSCKSNIRYIPIETVRIDTVYKYQVRVDSVYNRDYIYINQKGDTVIEYRYKYLYKYINRVDTFYISKTDSIPVPYPVEKPLSKWEQTKVNYGGYAIVLVIILILIVFGRYVYKLKT